MQKSLQLLGFLYPYGSGVRIDIKPEIEKLFPRTGDSLIDRKNQVIEMNNVLNPLKDGRDPLIIIHSTTLASVGSSNAGVYTWLEDLGEVIAEITFKGMAEYKMHRQDEQSTSNTITITGSHNNVNQSSINNSQDAFNTPTIYPSVKAKMQNPKTPKTPIIQNLLWPLVVGLIVGIIILAIEYNWFQ